MIADIHLQQFRSYQDAAFEFGAGVNIIVGPNASGKTNLLESLLVLASGKSYRTADMHLVAFGNEWARLDARVDDSQERTVKLQTTPVFKKTYEINTKPYARLPHDKKLPVVVFEPNHLQILQGSPDGRRDYLDDILEQTQTGYASVRKNYRRVLAQRNALLKHHSARQQDFFPWNLRLSELGAVMHRQRKELVDELNKSIGSLYQQIAGTNTQVILRYDGNFTTTEYESKLLKALESGLQKHLERGFTTEGPHREDVAVLFDGNATNLVASRGETRTAMLALKVLELTVLERATTLQPIMLLDDVFSELDGARRRALTKHLQQYQTFITTTDADIVVKHFTSTNIIPLS